MNPKEWIKTLQTPDEIDFSKSLFEKILSKSIADSEIYFEYLVIRLIAAINNFKNLEFDMKLDENFEPVSVAPGGKFDLKVTFDKIELIGEVTLRPISGKVDHFSHIEYPDRQIGFLFVQNIQNVDSNVWNTYKVYSKQNGKLFMICDIPFLLRLLENQQTAHEKLLEFIKNSKEIWLSEDSWKNIREKIVTLIT